MRRGRDRGGLGPPFNGGAVWPPVPQLWPGETVAILGAGPSASRPDAERLRGLCRLIAVNCSWELAPWADVLYACDWGWWNKYCPDFRGLRVSQDVHAAELIEGVKRVPSVAEAGLSLDPLRIHQGGNGGYQALNLAVLLGARRVILLGFDMQGTHWHGPHPSGLNNPAEDNFAQWRAAFAGAVPDLERAGVEVINCSRETTLECFPRRALEDVVAELVAEMPKPGLAAKRAVERDKYDRAYRLPNYRMGAARMTDAVADLEALPCRGSYLDVGCGRGEMLDHAARMGFDPVRGSEIVPALIDGVKVVRAEVHALPWPGRSFDVVSMFDVIEHVLPGDDELACRELARVSRKHVLLTANNARSASIPGEELHINRRPFDEWDRLFRNWFPGRVTWLGARTMTTTHGWRVDLP